MLPDISYLVVEDKHALDCAASMKMLISERGGPCLKGHLIGMDVQQECSVTRHARFHPTWSNCCQVFSQVARKNFGEVLRQYFALWDLASWNANGASSSTKCGPLLVINGVTNGIRIPYKWP